MILGQSQPTVLCLHGLGSSSRVWQKCLPEDLLNNTGFDCPDLPGHGDGARLSSYSLQSILKTLQHNLPPTITGVMGHSLGALLGLELARHNPRIQTLLALDFFPRARMPRGLDVLARHFRSSHEKQLRHFMSFSHTQVPHILDFILEDAQRAEADVYPEILESLAQRARQSEPASNNPVLQKIMVLHQPPGVYQLKSDSRPDTAWSAYANVECIQLKQPGHFVMLTNLQEFQQNLRHWTHFCSRLRP